jgi:hypothetical protein
MANTHSLQAMSENDTWESIEVFNLTTQYVPDLVAEQRAGNVNVRLSKPNIKVDYPNDGKILDALTMLILGSYVPDPPMTIEACRSNLSSAVGDCEEEDPKHVLLEVIFKVDKARIDWTLTNSEINEVLNVYKTIKANKTPIAGMKPLKITRELTNRGALPEKNVVRTVNGKYVRSRGLRCIRVRAEFIETALAANHAMPEECSRLAKSEAKRQ